MRSIVRMGAAASALAAALICTSSVAFAQKSGGILKMYHRDNPPTLSIHETATNSTVIPIMGVMNNLVLFDQNKPQNSASGIVPDLAKSWKWSPDGKALTFQLQEGVKWHDGKAFTAQDVVCTFDLLQGKNENNKLRANPRASWYTNVDKVTADGDLQATIHLKRPQPSLLTLLASGYSPIYPCHIPAAQMRTKPVGTGPFKFAELKQNESMKVVRNPDYWKKGRPYLDAIEFTIIANRATSLLAFSSAKFDMTFTAEIAAPALKDVKQQAPQAICEMLPTNTQANLLVNRDKPPFDDARVRRAMMLSIDRKEFTGIIGQGTNKIGGAMLPPPEGLWGMPSDFLAKIGRAHV